MKMEDRHCRRFCAAPFRSRVGRLPVTIAQRDDFVNQVARSRMPPALNISLTSSLPPLTVTGVKQLPAPRLRRATYLPAVPQRDNPTSLSAAPSSTAADVHRGDLNMLTIFGQGNRYCDGVSRRSFLRIGGLGIGAGAMSLADLGRLEAAAGKSSRQKSVINIFLG